MEAKMIWCQEKDSREMYEPNKEQALSTIAHDNYTNLKIAERMLNASSIEKPVNCKEFIFWMD